MSAKLQSFYRTIVLWWVGLIGPTQVLLWLHPQPREGWQGATESWSPMASVAAVEQTAAWDLHGWYQDAQRSTHRDLERVERRIDSRLDALLSAVYAWRDADGEVAWKHCWRPGSVGLGRLKEVPV